MKPSRKRTLITFIVLLIVTIAMTTSCNPRTEETRFTPKLELRQLINKEIVKERTSADMFFFIASYNNSTVQEDIVKIFINIDGYHKFISIPLKKIRVRIDNSIETPYLQVQYQWKSWIYSDTYTLEELTNTDGYYGLYDKLFLITCSEKYLPKKLLPIEIY